MIINKNNILFLYTLCLFPVFFIIGPAIVELSSLLILVFFISYKKNTEVLKLSIFENKNLYIFHFLLFFVFILCSVFSDNKNLSLYYTFTYFRYFIFLICSFYLISNYKEFLIKLKIILLIIFAILLFDSFYQFIFDKNILAFRNTEPGRVSSFFHHEYILGSYVQSFFFILLGLNFFFFKNNLKNIILLNLTIFVSLIIIIISGERTALFKFIFGIILILIFCKNFKKKLLLNFLIIPLIFIIIFSLSIKINQHKIDKKKHTINTSTLIDRYDFIKKKIFTPSSLTGLKFTIFSDQHELHYITAFKMFYDKPYFGHGLRTFRVKCDENLYKTTKQYQTGCSTHPHNTLMQVLSELGLLGFCLYFYLILYLLFEIIHFKKKYNLKKENLFNFYLCSVVYLIIYLLPFWPSGNLFNNVINYILYFNILIYLISKKLLLNEH